MEEERALRLVRADDGKLFDPDSGEVVEKCPNCEELERTYAELERKYRGALSQIGNLRADKDREARMHNLWGAAIALFQEWKQATNHPKSGWTADRFWLCEPFLVQDGFVLCRWAVWGIALEPNTKTLSTGLVERFDSWELCFRNRSTFERYVNRGHSHPVAKQWYAERPEQDVSE